MDDKRKIPIIEWQDLDKGKFYALGLVMTMAIRVSVYPFTLIRTRLQVQRGASLYAGTFDAFAKILRAEGVPGLYRGFLVNSLTLASGQCYVTTYELTRQYAARHTDSNAVKSVMAGGAASLVAQSLTVPIDVLSQHLMVQGQALGRFRDAAPTGRGMGRAKEVVVQILRLDGARGFYRGYAASLLTYIPNSALWWPFYHLYTAFLRDSQFLSPPPGSGCSWAHGSCNILHSHQPHGRYPRPSSGGRLPLDGADLQGADAGGGGLGPE
ncbi:solute carrier family 25 member 44-like isoform X2 [Hemiscyllium ocellatum]|uniref:solute carrier family 25 member 44-like isoform X2 n=1 Tax=Hemiscyllium ocellatum TaxID=170820 RepID=UPI002966DCB2|nr:solute carrier family 25 member 44-like isoform X2 [Hemiscyllium ocellatum]